MPPDDDVRLRHLIDAAETAIRFARERTRADLDNDEMLTLALTKVGRDRRRGCEASHDRDQAIAAGGALVRRRPHAGPPGPPLLRHRPRRAVVHHRSRSAHIAHDRPDRKARGLKSGSGPMSDVPPAMAAVTDRLVQRRTNRPLRVAVDGITAASKTTFASTLAQFWPAGGCL